MPFLEKHRTEVENRAKIAAGSISTFCGEQEKCRQSKRAVLIEQLKKEWHLLIDGFCDNVRA